MNRGVLRGLQLAKFVPQRVDRLAGLSGGGLVAAAQCTKSNFALAKQECFNMLDFCASDFPYFCNGKLDARVQVFLTKVLPSNTFTKCNNKLFVDVSRVINETGSSCKDCVPSNLARKLVSRFRSRDDMVDVLRATSFLAQGVSSPTSCTLKLREMNACDGAYATQTIPCPPNSKNCVRVSAYANQRLAAEIYPGMRGEHTMPIPAVQWNAISMYAVAVNATKVAMFQLGREDALFWAKQNA